MKRSYYLLLCSLWPILGIGQFSIEWNAWADAEVSYGQETSHYFYNSIHVTEKDWRLGISDLNVLAKTTLTPSLSVNLRARLQREQGKELSVFKLPLANITFAPPTQNWSVAVGRFITPFGNFAARQHPKDRELINVPLSNAYYTNVSPKVGFVERMGEEPFPLDGVVEWGSPLLYTGGYSNGIRWDWDGIPDKLHVAVALTNGTPNILHDVGDFSNVAVMGKLRYRPVYFWEQQVSMSYGTFQMESEANTTADPQIRQFLIGTDAQVGYKFWEFTGEVIYASYDVPTFIPGLSLFSDENLNLSTTSLLVRAKYEFPFLSGAYAAGTVEHLSFGKLEENGPFELSHWDDDVWRFNLGIGYKLNTFLLFRANYLWQEVDNFPLWAQNTFRSTLTIFY